MKGKGIYYEAHHIIPKCMGGEGKVTQWRTHPNIILLTAKEHFVVHKLLCEIYPDNQELIYTYWMFVNGSKKNKHSGNNYNIGSREYERTKIKFRIVQSENMSGENHPFFNKKQSQESNQKRRESLLGEKHHNFGKGEKQKGEKNPFFGKTHSEENREKSRERLIGKTGGESIRAKKVICILTNKVYGCINDAADDNKIKRTTLIAWLTGQNPNKSSLRYL
jgi:hypothetical protein